MICTFMKQRTMTVPILPTRSPTVDVYKRQVLLLLIQIGGMGITTLGVGIILLTGKKIGIRERTLIKESLNQPSFQGILRLLKVMLMVTFGIEGAGAVLSFPIFVQDYPVGKAVWLSVFHSVSAFNNAGFDLIGGSSLAAVSYTHLDVYKRQAPMQSAGFRYSAR